MPHTPIPQNLTLDINLSTLTTSLGKVYQDMGMPKNGIASFRRAVMVDPSYFEAYASLGGALTPLRLWRRAADILSHALKLNPSSAEGLYLLAFALMHICDWTSLEDALDRLVPSVQARLAASQPPGVEPYASLTFPWHPTLLKRIAEHHAVQAKASAGIHPLLPPPSWGGKKTGRILSVGIKSFDIGDHQVTKE